MRRWHWLLGLLVAGYLLTGLAQVGLNERAVVRRFGAVVARPGPGLHVGLPWPFERLDRVAVGYPHKVGVGYAPAEDERLAAGQLLTGDQNLINVQAVLAYTVREDDEALEAFVLQRDRIDGLVARAAEAALAEWVAGHPIDEVLLTGKAALRDWLQRRTQERLGPYRLGVAVTSAEVVYLAPPDEVKPEFDHVTGVQAGIRTREYEARQAAERKLNEAAAEKYRSEQQAAAYRFERLALARAEADAFVKRLEQYRRLRQTNPDILAAIWWDEMSQVFRRLKEAGRVDLLDNHLGADGLDITQFAPRTKRR